MKDDLIIQEAIDWLTRLVKTKRRGERYEHTDTLGLCHNFKDNYFFHFYPFLTVNGIDWCDWEHFSGDRSIRTFAR